MPLKTIFRGNSKKCLKRSAPKNRFSRSVSNRVPGLRSVGVSPKPRWPHFIGRKLWWEVYMGKSKIHQEYSNLSAKITLVTVLWQYHFTVIKYDLRTHLRSLELIARRICRSATARTPSVRPLTIHMNYFQIIKNNMTKLLKGIQIRLSSCVPSCRALGGAPRRDAARSARGGSSLPDRAAEVGHRGSVEILAGDGRDVDPSPDRH